MARMTANGLSGLIGTVVCYSIDGVEYARSRPSRKSVEKRKISPDNILFGEVTRYGSPMVKAFRLYDNPGFKFSLKTYNSMRGWIRNLHAKYGLDAPLILRGNNIGNLNPAADLRAFIPMLFNLENEGNTFTLKLNPFNPVNDIRSPDKTTSIRIKASVVTHSYKNGCAAMLENEILEIANTDEIRADLKFVLTVNPRDLDVRGNINAAFKGYMVMVAVSLEFILSNSDTYLKDPKWLPSGVIAMGRI